MKVVCHKLVSTLVFNTAPLTQTQRNWVYDFDTYPPSAIFSKLAKYKNLNAMPAGTVSPLLKYLLEIKCILQRLQNVTTFV